MDFQNTIACVSTEDSFLERVGLAAKTLGADFIAARTLEEPGLVRLDEVSSGCLLLDFPGSRSASVQTLVSRNISRRRVLLAAIKSGDVGAAVRAANVGAAGVFEKQNSDQRLEIFLESALVTERNLQRRIRSGEHFLGSAFDGLTVREKQVLRYLVEGEPNKRVASLLDVSLRTVEGDRASVMKKFEARSLAQLVKQVTLLEPDPTESRRDLFETVILERQGDLDRL